MGVLMIVVEIFGGCVDLELNLGFYVVIWVVMNCVVFFLIEC